MSIHEQVDQVTGEVLGGLRRIDRRLITGGDPDEPAQPPNADTFKVEGKEFLPAPDIEEIAEALISHHGFPWATEVGMSYFWKDKGGTSQGKAVLGKCVKLSGLAKVGIGGDFAIWLAADTARDVRLTAWQMEAAIYHELLHVGWSTESDTPGVVPHEFQGFLAELREYGAWHEDLASMTATQLPLFSN